MIDPIIIGKIGTCYGILGWNKLISYTENKKNIFQYTPWFIYNQKKWKKIILENKKIYNNKIFIKIININNRDQAKNITNNLIAIHQNTLPNLKKFEYYWKDIINCSVFTLNKNYIGNVIKIIRLKSNDILSIKKNKHHEKEILIPFIKKIFINKIDILNKIIYINQYEEII